MNSWIVTVIAMVGCAKLIFDAVFAVGRWTKTVEKDVEDKPKVTLERLSWDLERISGEIRDMRIGLDNHHVELSGRITADHQLIRELLNWKAGIYAEMSTHFYPIAMVDRMAKEGENDRRSLRAEINGLKETVYARRAGDVP